MSYDAYQYIRNRIVFAAIRVLLSAAFALWYFPSGTPEQRFIKATVLEVHEGTATSLRTQQEVRLITVSVRLDNGQEVLLNGFGQRPEQGQRVTVIEQTYPDGEQRYALASPAEAGY